MRILLVELLGGLRAVVRCTEIRTEPVLYLMYEVSPPYTICGPTVDLRRAFIKLEVTEPSYLETRNGLACIPTQFQHLDGIEGACTFIQYDVFEERVRGVALCFVLCCAVSFTLNRPPGFLDESTVS